MIGRTTDVRPNTNGVDARAVLRNGKNCADSVCGDKDDDMEGVLILPLFVEKRFGQYARG